MSMEDIHLMPGINVLINFCSMRLYSRTYRCVYKHRARQERITDKHQRPYSNEKVRLDRVEQNKLYSTFDLLERCL